MDKPGWTEADRESYRRQWAQAERRLPKGHTIHHAEWRGGVLTVQARRIERAVVEQAAHPKVRRGAFHGDLFA